MTKDEDSGKRYEMKCKPKIAVIGLKGLPAFGGAAAVGENIIEQLKARYDFTVYSTASHTDYKTGNMGSYNQIVFRKIKFRRLNTLYYYVMSMMHVLSSNYDLIHLHHRDAAFIIPLLRLRFKVILTIHGFGTFDLSDKWNKYKLFFYIQERYFIKYASLITTMSSHDIPTIKKWANCPVIFTPNGITGVINDSVDPISQNNYLILFAAGRIISLKRCEIFLEALIRIGYNGKIKVVGDIDNATSNYRKMLYALAKNLNNIEFTGLIKDKAELVSIYKQAKLFIFPSYREAMSMVLLEVASVKVPIIASRIPGNTQLFDDSEVLYFETDHVDDLSAKIQWSLANYNTMQQKAERAFIKLKNNYLWSEIAKMYSRHYDGLI